MIQIRKSEERGQFDFGWLKTYHSFSFGEYHDPEFMGFRQLRVINEDFVQAKQGFPTHPHRDMEIITYILEGALEHKDSMGTGSVIRPGEVQIMSAGTGVTHSEFNHSKNELVHLLQIWILPDRRGLTPAYQQKVFPEQDRKDQFCLIGSQDARDGSLKINQDVSLFATILRQKEVLSYKIKSGRHVWIQLARGEISINGKRLVAGDGCAVSEESKIEFIAIKPAEFLLFDFA